MHLPTSGSAGGILVGANADLFIIFVCDKLDFFVSVILIDKKSGFSWKLAVVYGYPYEEGKQAFLDELHSPMASWDGPTIIGGDFNLVRFAKDKNNSLISHRWSSAFSDWVSKCGLIEIDPPNKLFTWTKN